MIGFLHVKAALAKLFVGQIQVLLGNTGAVNQALSDHPLNLIVNGFLVGAGGVTQLILCLGAVEFIVPGQVVDGKSGHQRHFSGLFRLLFQTRCDLVRQVQRQIELDFLGITLGVEHIAHFLQRDRLIGQDVAFADAALVHGCDGTGGQVPDIAKVEAALHTHGHLALNDLKQGVGRLADGMVIGAQNAGRMYHTGFQAHDLNSIQHHLGGCGFTLGVSAHNPLGIAGGKLGNLGDRCAVGLFGDCTGGRNIDHFLTLRMVQNLGDDIPGTAYIDSHQLLGIVGVHGNHRSTVNHHGRAALRNGKEGLQRSCIGQITQHHFHLGGDEFHRLIIGQHQGTDLAPLFQQLHTDIGAQETGGTGQQIIAVLLHIPHLNLS